MGTQDIVFGVDVGGTTIKFAAVWHNKQTLNFEILSSFSLPTGSEISPDAVLGNIIKGVKRLLKNYPDVRRIGVGMPGVINEQEEVCYPPNFNKWGKVPLRKNLSEKLAVINKSRAKNSQWSVAVENDANTAAIAELKYLSGMMGSANNTLKKKSQKSFLFITLGTGVGGCIITNGHIFRGAKGGAGEVGHISIDFSGNKCKCGSQGCIESYIGQKYMSAQALELLQNPTNPHKNSLLFTMIKNKILTPELINNAAEKGDKFANQFLKTRGAMLGAALASVLNLLDIREVVIGGGTAQSRVLIQATKTECKKRLLQTIQTNFKLRLAHYTTDSGVIGAAALEL